MEKIVEGLGYEVTLDPPGDGDSFYASAPTNYSCLKNSNAQTSE